MARLESQLDAVVAGPTMKADDVRNIGLLQGLDPDTLERVAGLMHVRVFERSQWVLRKDERGDQLMFVLSGLLQVLTSTYNGSHLVLRILRPGEHFGELSVIDRLPRSTSVQALETSLVANLAQVHALELFYQQPLVAERVLKRLAHGLREATRMRTILALPHAAQRICAVLAHLSHLAPGGLAVVDPLPRQADLAAMSNTSRETVSRVLQELTQQQVIQKDRRRLIVRNPDVLSQALLGQAQNID